MIKAQQQGATNPPSSLTLLPPTLRKKNKKFFTNTHYHGIYRDGIIVAFKGNQKVDELRNWLQKFQQLINEITGSTFLQFTMEVWDKFSVSNNKNRDNNDKTTSNAHQLKNLPFHFSICPSIGTTSTEWPQKPTQNADKRYSLSVKRAPTEGHA